MSLTGPAALRSIEEALRDIRREEDELVRRLGRSAELITKTHAQEGELVRQLLAIRLEPDARAALVGEIAAAEARAAATLDQHESDLDAAAADLARIDDALADAAAERVSLQGTAAARDGELRALVDSARPRLGTDAAYADRLAEARALAAAAEQTLHKTAQAEADRERKGRPYRDDPLFMYLWEKGYGARTYRANALVAWLDARIAALIGYGRARANFLLINEIPLRLRDHAEMLRTKAQAAALAVAALESAAVDSAGGQPAREAMEEIVGRIAALDRRIAELEDQRDEAIRAERNLAQGDAAFAGALGALADLLERADLRRAIGEARTAPKGQDPTVLAQIDELRRRALDEDDEAREQKSRLRTLAARRRDLEDLAYEIKMQGFDNPHSRFEDDDLGGEALNVFLHGEINLAGYWDRWRISQKWDRQPGYGGPGGGWGRLARPAGKEIGRPRAAAQPARGERLTTAA